MSSQEQLTRTHYDVLGVSPDADLPTIKRAHRKVMRENHPDVAGDQGAALCSEANVAFSVLSDAGKRASYDLDLTAPAPEVVEDEVVEQWGEDAEWEPEQAPASTPSSPGRPPAAEDFNTWRAPSSQPPVVVVSPGDTLWVHYAAGAMFFAVMLVLAVKNTPIPAVFPDTPLVRLGVVLGLPIAIAVLTRSSTLSMRSHPAIGYAALAAALAVVELAGTMLLLWHTVFALIAARVVADSISSLNALQRTADGQVSVADTMNSNSWGGTTSGSPTSQSVITPLVNLASLRSARFIAIDNKVFTHIVIYGRRIALLGALPTGPGRYRWTRRGLEWVNTDGAQRLVVDPLWAKMARVIASILRPKAMRVFFVGAAGEYTVSGRSNAVIVDADRACEVVGDWLTAGGLTGVVDQRLLAQTLVVEHEISRRTSVRL